MASKGQTTGMIGVYLVAAELSKLGFIVSPTSRSAAGADLLVTDQRCKKAWSVQVKTNSSKAKFWLLGSHAKEMGSESHIYVFVDNAHGDTPEYTVVPNVDVVKRIDCSVSSKGSKWYAFYKSTWVSDGPGWELFGNPFEDANVPVTLPGGSSVEILPDPSEQ
jgi:hypothetical protein